MRKDRGSREKSSRSVLVAAMWNQLTVHSRWLILIRRQPRLRSRETPERIAPGREEEIYYFCTAHWQTDLISFHFIRVSTCNLKFAAVRRSKIQRPLIINDKEYSDRPLKLPLTIDYPFLKFCTIDIRRFIHLIPPGVCFENGETELDHCETKPGGDSY